MPVEYLYLLIGTAIGLTVGFLVAFLIAGRKKAQLERELALSNQECAHRAEELARITDDDSRRKAEFNQMSEEILLKRQTALEDDNLRTVSALVEPIRVEFEKFQRLVREARDADTADSTALRHLVSGELRRMQELAERVGSDARGLKAALTGNVNARGQWGEAILEQILASSGLLKDIHYTTQFVIADDDGKGRPDMIVHQPDGTNVVIDSKALFPNYCQYFEAETPEAKKRALAEHLQSVRDTVTALSKRSYETRISCSVEFVIMFFPLEGAYQLAIANEPKLLTDALAKHVLLVGPATLIVMLTIIERIWRRNDQDRNARAILAAAQELADRVMAFGSDLDAVGKGLDDARDAYDAALKRLSSPDGRARSVKTALSALEDLKVKSAKSTPKCLAD